MYMIIERKVLKQAYVIIIIIIIIIIFIMFWSEIVKLPLF
jgi:hypothetical protein